MAGIWKMFHQRLRDRRKCIKAALLEAPHMLKNESKLPPGGSAYASKCWKLFPRGLLDRKRCIEATPPEAPRMQKMHRLYSLEARPQQKIHRIYSLVATAKNIWKMPPHVCKCKYKCIEATHPEAPRIQKCIESTLWEAAQSQKMYRNY